MPRQDTKSAKQTEGRGRERDAYGFLRGYQQSGLADYKQATPAIDQSQVQLGDITFGRGANQIGGTNASTEIAELLFAGISAAEGIAKTVKTITETHDDKVASEALADFAKEKETKEWKALPPEAREQKTADVYTKIADGVWSEKSRLNYQLKGQEFQDKVDPTKFEYFLQNVVVGRQAIISSNMSDEEKATQLRIQTEEWQKTLDTNFSENPELHQKGLLALYGFKIDDHEKTASAIATAFQSVFPTLEDFTASTDQFFYETRGSFPQGTSNEELWQHYFTWLGSQGNPLPEFFGTEEAFASTWGSNFTDVFVKQRNRMAKRYATQDRSFIVADAQSKLNVFRDQIYKGYSAGQPQQSLVDLAPIFLDHLNTLVLSDPTGLRVETELIETLGSLVPSLFRDMRYSGPVPEDPREMFDAVIKKEILPFVVELDFLTTDAQRERVMKGIRDSAFAMYSRVTPSGSKRDAGLSPNPQVMDVYTDTEGKPEKFTWFLETHVAGLPVGDLNAGEQLYHRESGAAAALDMWQRGIQHHISRSVLQNNGVLLNQLTEATGLSRETVLSLLARPFDTPSTKTEDELTHELAVHFQIANKGRELTTEQTALLRQVVMGVRQDSLLSNVASLYQEFESGAFVLDQRNIRAASEGIYEVLDKDKAEIGKYAFTLDGSGIVLDNRKTNDELVFEAISKGKTDEVLALTGMPDKFYDSLSTIKTGEATDLGRLMLASLMEVDSAYQLHGQELSRKEVGDILMARAEGVPGRVITKVQNALHELRQAQVQAQESEDPEAAITAARLEIIDRVSKEIGAEFQATQYEYLTETREGFAKPDWNPETRDVAWNDYSYISDFPRNQRALEAITSGPDWGARLRATIGNSATYAYVDSVGTGDFSLLGLTQFLDDQGLKFRFERVGEQTVIVSGIEPKPDENSLRDTTVFALGNKTRGLIDSALDWMSGTEPLPEQETRTLGDSWQYRGQGSERRPGPSLQIAFNSIDLLEGEGDLHQRDANALRSTLYFLGNAKEAMFRSQDTGITPAKLDATFMGRAGSNEALVISELFENNEDAYQLVRSIYRAKKANNEPFTITMEDLALVEMQMKERSRSARVDDLQNEFYLQDVFALPEEEIRGLRSDISSLTGQRSYVRRLRATDGTEQVVSSEIFPYVAQPVEMSGLAIYKSFADQREDRQITESAKMATSQDMMTETFTVPTIRTPSGKSMAQPGKLGKTGQDVLATGAAIHNTIKHLSRQFREWTNEVLQPARESVRRAGQELQESNRTALQQYSERTKQSNQRLDDFFANTFKGLSRESLREGMLRAGEAVQTGNAEQLAKYGELVEKHNESFYEFFNQLPEDLRKGMANAGRAVRESNQRELVRYQELMDRQSEQDKRVTDYLFDQALGFALMVKEGALELVDSETPVQGLMRPAWGEEFIQRSNGITPQELGLSKADVQTLLKLNDKDFQYMVSWYTKNSR